VVYQKQDRLAESAACLTHAVEVTGEVAAGRAGTDTHSDLSHALTLNNLGFVQLRLGRPDLAVPRFEAAFRTLERLQALEPSSSNWALRCAFVGQGYAAALQEAGRAAEGLPLLQRFEVLWAQQTQPTQPAQPAAVRDPMLRRLAMNRSSQAACLVDLGRAEDALPLAHAAQAQMAELAQASPQDRDLLLYHAETLAVLARADRSQGASWQAQAAAVYDRAGALRPLTHDHLRARQALA
jgi:tetratricopeptide (TPR) repeat protein